LKLIALAQRQFLSRKLYFGIMKLNQKITINKLVMTHPPVIDEKWIFRKDTTFRGLLRFNIMA
jgi:hypothetical protein